MSAVSTLFPTLPQRLNGAWCSIADVAVCLSLKERTERRTDTVRELKRVYYPIGDRFYFWLEAERHPTDTNLGIFLGHQRAIQHAFTMNPSAETILIFEDDLLVEDNLEKVTVVLEEAVLWQRQQSAGRAYMLRLGCLPILAGIPVFGYEHMVALTYAVNMHAYILSRRAAEVLMRANFVRHLPIDSVVNFWFRGANYVTNPMICSQRNESSDNTQVFWAPLILPIREMCTHDAQMRFAYGYCFRMLPYIIIAAAIMLAYIGCRLAKIK